MLKKNLKKIVEYASSVINDAMIVTMDIDTSWPLEPQKPYHPSRPTYTGVSENFNNTSLTNGQKADILNR